MKSKIFYSKQYETLQAAIFKLINEQPDFLTSQTASSPRAAGDAIQGVISDKFKAVLGDVCTEYSAEFARRAMADLAFKDRDGLYYIVDVKTHRLGTAFNMPNLTSVERLARFYEDDANYFVVLVVQYEVDGVKVRARTVHFLPIEFLAWGCLTVGALGWGQIQIANANTITVNPGYSRKAWMLELCDIMLEFYPKEIAKIGDRVAYFEKVKERWANRKEP